MSPKIKTNHQKNQKRKLNSSPQKKRRISRPELKPIDPGEQAMFNGYIQSKAERLLEYGIEEYSSQDFFSMPSKNFNKEQREGLLHGCKQLSLGNGLTIEKPMEGVSVAACYALIHSFHFKVIGRKTHRPDRLFLDELHCEHRMTGFTGALFNLVVYS